jgi:hypothetical protein
MNQKIASKRKSLFIKKAFGMAGAAAFIIAALFLAGCSTGVGYDVDEAASGRAVLSVMDVPSIYGTWRDEYENPYSSGYEEFEITGSTLTYTFSATPGGDYGLSYVADIAEIVYSDEINYTSGVIIIEYTTPPADNEAYTFNAVYFDGLTEDTVVLANAVTLPSYLPSAVATLTAAEDKFIWDDDYKYIDWENAAEQTRQP